MPITAAALWFRFCAERKFRCLEHSKEQPSSARFRAFTGQTTAGGAVHDPLVDISLVMLPVTIEDAGGPLVIMLHWLGGSAKTWTEVIEGCSARGLSCAALDVTGFGDAAQHASAAPSDFTVAANVAFIIDTIRALRAESRTPWLLAGHSMGGKFAAIIARAALDGIAGLDNLRGLILISPSPPSPEPMDESVRRENIESLGRSTLDAHEDRARAETFVDDNTGKLPLREPIRNRTVDDLLRMNRSAFTAWFKTGSKEDWSARVGTLSLPALVLAGTAETALGINTQREHTLPHLAQATLIALEGAGHLSPLERPAELANRILAFVKDLGISLPYPSMEPVFARKLIESNLTSPQTRAVLNQRVVDDHLSEPSTLNPDELLTLRAAAARIIPGCSFDLSARVHRWLALSAHDGWRHDTLPPDTEAWRIGLHSLDAASLRRHEVPFSALDASRQDDLLSLAQAGNLEPGLFPLLHGATHSGLYTAKQMSDWFGDLHAELTRMYVADPRTLNRIGFTGFADEAGFTQIRLGEQEDFEQ